MECRDNTYDLIPYPSRPYARTHPRHLEALALLMGMNPPPSPMARVLEMGCGRGGNLIPIAETSPQSRLLGIDLSVGQIEDGCSVIRELGLENIELRPAGILDIDDGWGTFDYILCHGVYSWVPADVQRKILEVSRRNLAPQGVALVSYNTFPGWHLRVAIRDMMQYHSADFDRPEEKIAQARAMIEFVAAGCDAGTPFGQFLQNELKHLRKEHDAYIFHEYLENVNEPLYFHQFIQRAEACGLQYLSDAVPSHMAMLDVSETVRNTLAGVPPIAQQQYLDFIRNVAFRSTLLCHREIELSPRHERLAECFVAFSARPKTVRSGAAPSDLPTFEVGDSVLTTTSPLVAEAFAVLAECWPAAAHVPDLIEQVRRRSSVSSVPSAATEETVRAELLSGLLTALGTGALAVYRHAPQFEPHIGPTPVACRLARYHAARGGDIPSRLHFGMHLDAIGRFVIRHLDGQHDREALVACLRHAISAGELAEFARQSPNCDPRQAPEMVDWALRTCADTGLLVG